LRLQKGRSRAHGQDKTDKEIEWQVTRGTRVEIELEAKYHKGRQSVEEYLEQTVIANPHVSIETARR
jgi:DNA topoisomerase VI subunit B